MKFQMEIVLDSNTEVLVVVDVRHYVIQLNNSFVKSRVDYCNSILTVLPSYHLDRIQSVINLAFRSRHHAVERLTPLVVYTAKN